MNDFELESKLKAARVPEKTDEYWADFPTRVRSQLPRAAIVERTQTRWMPQWAWNGGFALACALFGFLLWPAFHAVLKDERAWQRDAARLPNQLRLLMADEHGMQYLVQD